MFLKTFAGQKLTFTMIRGNMNQIGLIAAIASIGMGMSKAII